MKVNNIRIILVSIFIIIVGILLIIRLATRPTVLSLGIIAGSMWENPGANNKKLTDGIIKSFQNEHNNVTIKYRFGIRKEDYSEWLSQQILNGDEPDIFCILPSDFNMLASIGALENLDTYVNNNENFSESRFYSTALKSGRFGGSVYALPREIDPMLMFVNEGLLKKEGIQTPDNEWTWDNFLDICKKVTKDTDGDGYIDQFGIIDFSWMVAISTNAQKLFDDYGENAYFDQKGVIDSIELISKLNKISKKTNPTESDFNNGKVAFRPFPFSWYRSFNISVYRITKFSDINWKCIKLPRGPEGKNSSYINTYLFGISSRAKHKKEAWEFLEYLTTDIGVQSEIIQSSEGVSVLKEVTGKFNGAQSSKSDSFSFNMLNDVIEESQVIAGFSKYQQVIDYADRELYKALNENEDIVLTLQRINKQANEILKSNQ